MSDLFSRREELVEIVFRDTQIVDGRRDVVVERAQMQGGETANGAVYVALALNDVGVVSEEVVAHVSASKRNGKEGDGTGKQHAGDQIVQVTQRGREERGQERVQGDLHRWGWGEA